MICDKKYRLTFTKKAEKLVSKMSLEEKVYLMSGRVDLLSNLDIFENTSADNHYNDYPYPAGGNKRLGIPEMLFCDGPRGVVTEKSTCFPVTMARGATFNTDLEKKVGEAIGKEIRAYGANFFGGVCINTPYNPGWGRSQETYGEDNYHLGTMGSALVEGVQNHNVMACIKHFAFNSMENGRFKVSVEADKRTEREVYLDHFKMCIDSGAACVMSSYNKYQDVYCGQNKYLLNDVLRDEWDFDGFVVSDFVWGTRNTVNAANAGLNVEMCDTHFYGDNLVKAVKAGEVSETVIDKSVIEIVRTILAFSEAEDPQEYPRKIIGCVDHINLAKEVAEEAITLVKNEDKVLPFSKASSKKIAVIGELGNFENIGDHGSSRVFPDYVVTPLQGICNLMQDSTVSYCNGNDIAEAKKIASEADTVIVVAGYKDSDEGEYLAPMTSEGSLTKPIGGDRKESLGLHKNEISLIKEISKENQNLAVVLIGGNMITINEWEKDVPAILMAYYPGMEGGTAIASILFGDVNPSGKLPFVVVKDEADLPSIDWLADVQKYDFYHGYTKLDHENIEADVPFGFGLSYTDFKLSDEAITVTSDEIIASCKVKNIGEVEGAEVIQLYIGAENSKVIRPVKKLSGFNKINLLPNEDANVEIKCGFDRLKYYTESGWELEKGITYLAYIGTSSNIKDLQVLKFNL